MADKTLEIINKDLTNREAGQSIQKPHRMMRRQIS